MSTNTYSSLRGLTQLAEPLTRSSEEDSTLLTKPGKRLKRATLCLVKGSLATIGRAVLSLADTRILFTAFVGASHLIPCSSRSSVFAFSTASSASALGERAASLQHSLWRNASPSSNPEVVPASDR